ncbi:MAG: TonB-dependent receptor [Flavobacteriales bacterium]|nr:TonB-dependent receptor [Flavobacteriales bacterium]
MKHVATAVLLFICLASFAQDKVTLSGYVKDGDTGEGMIGSTVLVKELSQGTSSNEYGFYSLTLTPGTYTIEWSFIGYTTVSEQIDFTKNATRNVELSFGQQLLNEVVITGEREDEALTSVEMSVEKLDMQQVKKIPQLLGEADIIRSIQLLPGVTTVGEGATGFNVRGGNIDQNLILLDESPLFSSSHLFGFFSIFNADAIKDTKLYKGGIPAKYGGRLSSVLDIRQKEGNSKHFSASGGLGLLFSRLTIEGPILKDKVSFIVSGRRSYFDIFFPLANNDAINDSRLYFYDLNGKINWTINEKNRVYVSGYFGDDVFNLTDLFSTRWGNKTFSLRWNHLFSERIFANFTGVFSDYTYNLGADFGGQGFDWRASIRNYSAKADFTYFLNPENKIEFGWHSILYDFSPGKADASFEVGDEIQEFSFEVPPIPAFETALYFSNEHKISPRLTLTYGIRYSAFAQLGEGTIYDYDNDQPVGNPIVDSTLFGTGEIVKYYHGPEPRFSANYQINELSSVKASYNRMRQYIHLISNTTAATPVDIYMPSGKYIKPAIADQVGLGYFRNFLDNRYESSTEVYYKHFQNLVDYKDEAELLLNNTLETELYTGRGRAYGLEVQIKKKRGKLTGWISYTLSRVEREVEQINNGEAYPANWDKTHDISVVLSYDITKRINVSSNFAYMTGRPITYPDGRFQFGGVTAPLYTNRNGARTPAYHRLDLSAYVALLDPEKRKATLDLAFGAYNLYARKNPYSIFFQEDPDSPGRTQAIQLSIYATIIPYVTLNFSF